MRRARRKATSSSACSSLIDISLTGNLILIVVFSGYENFVSKIDPGGHPDWPDWMTKVNFGGLKQKLLASIVAISAIQVLKAFMNIDTNFDPNQARLAGRRASGVRVLGLHARDLRPLERRRSRRRVADSGERSGASRTTPS